MRVVEQPLPVETGMAIWNVLRTALVESLDDDGPLRKRAAQKKLDAWGADLAVFVVERCGTELHVGRDLQFIRINGTIVGGLVGLVIHAFAQVVR